MLIAYCSLIVLLTAAVPQQGTPPAQQKPEAQAPKVDPGALQISVERIQKALAKTPMLRFDQKDQPLFRVQVFGDKPTIEEILGPDFATRPVPHGSMTHRAFLAMVTPKETQGYAGFSSSEGITVAATSALLQWTLQKALQKYHASSDDRQREAARQEVLEALKALEDARAKAGMPPK
jgi:hypothetical protein